MLEGPRLRLRRHGWRFRRFLENLSYRLRYSRLPGSSGLRPSSTAVAVAVILFTVSILAGGAYDLLEKPIALLPQPGQRGWSFVYPGTISIQTINESLISALLYLLGIGGLFLLLRGTRLAYRPRNAYLFLILGFVAILITFSYFNFLIGQKV